MIQFYIWIRTNEWAPSENFMVLYLNLYNYIQMYLIQKKINKIKAFLPLKILRTYTLADKFVLGNQEYRINSITTNLGTGESVLNY